MPSSSLNKSPLSREWKNARPEIWRLFLTISDTGGDNVTQGEFLKLPCSHFAHMCQNVTRVSEKEKANHFRVSKLNFVFSHSQNSAKKRSHAFTVFFLVA